MEKLQLAAYLGDEASHLALSDSIDQPKTFVAWIRGLSNGRVPLTPAQSREACARAGVAALQQAIPAWEVQNLDCGRLHAELRVVEEWIRCPCDHHESAVINCVSKLQAGGVKPILHLGFIVFARDDEMRDRVASCTAQIITRAGKALGVRNHQQVMRSVVQRALLPWALEGPKKKAEPKKKAARKKKKKKKAKSRAKKRSKPTA